MSRILIVLFLVTAPLQSVQGYELGALIEGRRGARLDALYGEKSLPRQAQFAKQGHRGGQEEVESPFIFKRIFIQELKLNIPWASLRYQPAKVSIRANRICTTSPLRGGG